MTSIFKVIFKVPKKGILDPEKHYASLRRQTPGLVNKTILWYSKPTKNWEHKPSFSAEVSSNPISYRVFVHPGGDDERFVWTDLGVKPRVIRAKRAPRLRFLRGYKASTRPGSLVGGRAKRSKPWVSYKEVNWQGVRARHFTEQVAKRMKRDWTKLNRQAIKDSILMNK